MNNGGHRGCDACIAPAPTKHRMVPSGSMTRRQNPSPPTAVSRERRRPQEPAPHHLARPPRAPGHPPLATLLAVPTKDTPNSHVPMTPTKRRARRRRPLASGSSVAEPRPRALPSPRHPRAVRKSPQH